MRDANYEESALLTLGFLCSCTWPTSCPAGRRWWPECCVRSKPTIGLATKPW